MAERIRAHAWADTLGTIETWPISLRTTLGLMLDTSHAMCLAWGSELTFFYNDAYAKFLADRHPQALGRPFQEVWADEWKDIAPLVEQALRGEPVHFEDMHLAISRPGGVDDTWWTFSYSPARDDTGAIVGMLNVTTETTGKVLAIRETQGERERLRQTLQRMPGFVALLEGPEHRFTYVNDAYVALSGPRAFVGRTVEEVFPELVGQGFYELLDQVYATTERFAARAFPVVLSQDGGSTRHVDFLYEPVHDEKGAVTGIFVGGYDTTERVRAQTRLQALADLSDRLRAAQSEVDLVYAAAKILGDILGVSRVGYGTIDDVLETLHVERDWNAQGVETLAGVVPLREYGSFIDSLRANKLIAIADVRLDTRTAAAAAALEDRDARAFVKVPVVEQDRLVAVLYVNNDVVRHWREDELALIRDVAERTRTALERMVAEAALRHSKDTLEQQVQRRTAELMATEEALRQSQKMEAVGQLTGGIAHDFNNLLAGISGSLDLIGNRIAQGRYGDIERFSMAAQHAAKRAAALTHRLLAFSRRQTLDPKPTSPNRLIRDMEDLIRRTVGPSIEVEVVASAGLWSTLVDPHQLENALLNLCINARDAMPAGGRLTIETANRWMDDRAAKPLDLPAGQYVSLCVSDTGQGMAPEVVERAFEPFFTTKPIGMGTGLGLSMIYGFARQSGGQVRIYSEPGQGAMVCIYLPRYAGDVPDAETAPEAEALPRAQDGETVLVVDDEPTVRMLVAEVLHELGYHAIEAGDGPSGLRILQSNARIDLLVTDVGLPGGLNGRQLADAARQHRPDLKVLFITGYAENAVVGNGLLETGMHVMTKPFEMDALSKRIGELIGG
jgi:signal transduction histidine kinase/PAS domain-containing protein